MIKSFGDTFLYRQYGDYDKKLFEFIMKADEIDASSNAFADVLFDVKRQNIGVSIANVATSSNIKLMVGPETLPTQFKVFAAKDLKGKNRDSTKIYIDCTGVIMDSHGTWVCRDIDRFISYLISAMVALIWAADNKRIINNAALSEAGAGAYSIAFTHIVDYLFKISVEPEIKAKCKYLTSRFYLEHVVGKESSTVSATARKIAGISEREERVIEIGCNDKSFSSLPAFVETLNHILKKNLTIDALVDKWMFIFGQSTVFGLEFFPAFSSMLTDAYVGSYLNNQKTIEKIMGDEMVTFTKTIFTIGANALNGK